MHPSTSFMLKSFLAKGLKGFRSYSILQEKNQCADDKYTGRFWERFCAPEKPSYITSV